MELLKTEDLVGKKYGHLTIIEDLGRFAKEGTKQIKHYVKCICDCENHTEKIIDIYRLRSGETISCGCVHKYNLDKARRKKRKYNEYYSFNDIIFVKYSNCDEYFICDLEDWEKYNKYCWYKNFQGYPCTRIKKGQQIFFHNLIMPNSNGVVDHIFQISNGVCDNRKSNLRNSKQIDNSRNSLKPKNNTSGFKGVSYNKKTGKWEAYIGYNFKTIHLGLFTNKKDAIKARVKKEIELFKEYSTLYPKFVECSKDVDKLIDIIINDKEEQLWI